jgi:hypothetical protein
MGYQKIKQCIDIANECRKEKYYEKLAFTNILKSVKDFYNGWWTNSDWNKKANIFLLTGKVLFFVILFLIYLSVLIILLIYQLLFYPIRKYYLKEKYIFDYHSNECPDFFSLWQKKGLPSSMFNFESYDNKEGFGEKEVIECMIQWYKILKNSDYAQRVCDEIIRGRQELFANANGIYNMEPISSTLLKKINFPLSEVSE